jgi:predicted nucleic acid-binding protein
MSSIERIYLDTNIFISAFEKGEMGGSLLSDLFTVPRNPLRNLFVTSELTLSELLVVPYRNGDADLVEGYATLVRTNAWLDVIAVDRVVLVQASKLRSERRGLKLPDAIHLATALKAECSHLLTEDKGLEVAIAASALPLTVLRPDEPTLSSLIESLSQ